MTQCLWKEECKKKIWTPLEWEKKGEEVKRTHKTFVTLNGSFDLLHAGHLQILYEAKKQGDFLLVALNTDASIKGYKSPHRPIVPLNYRMEMLTALSFVDGVTYFDDLDPIRFLLAVKPHVHVNGSEYGENCVEAPTLKALNAKLHIVSLVPGLSTSSLLQTIKKLPE